MGQHRHTNPSRQTREEAPFWRGCADGGDGSEQMVDDQHDDADDMTDADNNFEAAVGHLTPGLLARVRTAALTRGMSGTVVMMPGLGARGDDGGSRQGTRCAMVFGSL